MSTLNGLLIRSPLYGAATESTISVASSRRATLAVLDHATDFATGMETRAELLHLAHLLNAVRNNQDLRQKIERYVSSLRIVYNNDLEHDGTFNLNSPPNLIFLMPDLHTAYDKTGDFLIVASHECLEEATEELVRANEAWVIACQSNAGAIRTINFRLSCFTQTRFEILIMQAARAGRTHILHNRIFAHHGSEARYIVDPANQSLVRDDSSAAPLEPFPSPPTDRMPSQHVNLLLLTIHNASRFRSHHADPNREEITNAHSLRLESLITSLEKQIIFKPANHLPVEQDLPAAANSSGVGPVTRSRKVKHAGGTARTAPQNYAQAGSHTTDYWQHPMSVEEFYAALAKPGEEVDGLCYDADMPSSPVSIDLSDEEVEAMLAKQDRNWEVAMSQSETPDLTEELPSLSAGGEPQGKFEHWDA